MDTTLLNAKFARIGARLRIADRPANRFRPAGPVALDVRADRRGEFFEVARRAGENPAVEVLDIRPADRHLLLLVRDGTEKGKFLCGHDERHWFVAAVPEAAPVGTVRQAMEALKPPEVRAAQAVERDQRTGRDPPQDGRLRPPGGVVFRPGPGFRRRPPAGPDERAPAAGVGREAALGGPLLPDRRGDGLRVPQVPERGDRGRVPGSSCNPQAANWGWRVMRRNPGVYVTGRVRHAGPPDDPLRGWHRVVDEHRGRGEGDAERGLPGLTGRG